MKSTLKMLCIALAGLVGFATVAIVGITVLIDPNDYKSQIEDLAQQQGYPIAIEGDLSWQFFPKLGITIGHSKLLGAQPQSPELASIDAIRASVMVLPLFNKKVVIDEVVLEAITADLQIDAQGSPNWQHLLPQANADTGPQTPSKQESTDQSEPSQGSSARGTGSGGHNLALAANRVRIQKANLHYLNHQSGTEIWLQPLDMTLDQFNLNGDAFPVQARWAAKVRDSALPETLINTGELTATATIAADLASVEIAQGQLSLTVGEDPIPLSLSFVATAASLSTTPQFDVALTVVPADLKAIANLLSSHPLHTRNPKALTQVGATLKAKGTADNWQVKPLTLTLDQTKISGALAWSNANQFSLTLQGGAIQVDDYLPPESEVHNAEAIDTTSANKTPRDNTSPKPAAAAEKPASITDVLAPLNDYQGDIDIVFDQLQMAGLTLSQPTLKATLADGVFKVEPISANIQGKTVQLAGWLNSTGAMSAQISVPKFNLRTLIPAEAQLIPETADPNTLTAVGLKAAIEGDIDQLQLRNIQLDLDETRITGQGTITNADTLKLQLSGNTLDLDRYLPPTSETPSNASENAEPAAETPLDFSTLHDYNGQTQLTFDHLKANNLTFNNLKLAANNKKGLAQLTSLSADFYQGTLQAQGQLDARAEQPTLSFTGKGKGVAIKPLLSALENTGAEQQWILSGLTNGSVTLKTRGTTTTRWSENADATLNATTQQLQLIPINIEKLVCQAVALVQGESVGTIDWPELTKMQDLNAQIRYANQVASIEKLTAGVEQFSLLAKGKVDIGNETMDVQLPVKFAKPSSPKPGCPATSAWLVDQALSLVRCKGSLLEPTKACGLDNRAIREAVKDYAEAKARAKLDQKKQQAEQKLDEKKDRLKDKIDRELGDGASDLLKDLFKRNQPKKEDSPE